VGQSRAPVGQAPAPEGQRLAPVGHKVCAFFRCSDSEELAGAEGGGGENFYKFSRSFGQTLLAAKGLRSCQGMRLEARSCGEQRSQFRKPAKNEEGGGSSLFFVPSSWLAAKARREREERRAKSEEQRARRERTFGGGGSSFLVSSSSFLVLDICYLRNLAEERTASPFLEPLKSGTPTHPDLRL
jgi:hypothetical protein